VTPLSSKRGTIQVACDRCTQGVMDSTNPHLLGTCPCSCHLRPELRMSTDELEVQVEEWVRNG
jgi:hypothetical protein